MKRRCLLAILLAMAAFSGCRDETSPTNADLPVTPSLGVTASAADAIRAYVTNIFTDNVSVIDVATNTVVATVPVGRNPLNVALTPDGAFAYVTNAGDGTVSVIDAASNAVVATVGELGRFPEGIAITPDGAFAYVAIYGSPPIPGSVSVIATSSNTVIATIENVGGAPLEVAVTPDGASVFVTNRLSNDVTVIDVATNTVETTIPVGTYPVGIAFTPDGSTAYVVNQDVGTVSVIDVDSREVFKTIDTPLYGFGVALNPDGSEAYVTIESDPGSITIIDVASRRVRNTIPDIGRYPEGIAISPDGASAYVATYSSPPSVAVIDLGTGSVSTRVEVPGRPVWVAITPSTTEPSRPGPHANEAELNIISYDDANENGAFDTGEDRIGSYVLIESQSGVLVDECLTPCELLVPPSQGYYVWQLQEPNWDLLSIVLDGAPTELEERPPDEAEARQFLGTALLVGAEDDPYTIVFQNLQLVRLSRIQALLEDSWIKLLIGDMTDSGRIERELETTLDWLQRTPLRLNKVADALADLEAAIVGGDPADAVHLAYLQLVVDRCQGLLAQVLGA